MRTMLCTVGAGLALAILVPSCGDDGATNDAGDGDAGTPVDSGRDTGVRDSGQPDTAMMMDAGPACTGAECNIVDLATGFAHTCALRANGQILCWGSNENGELGSGRMVHDRPDCTPSKATEPVNCSATPVLVDLPEGAVAIDVISESGFSTCARVESGEVYCWGLEAVPPMGSDVRTKRFTPVEIPQLDGAVFYSDNFLHHCGVLADGTVVCGGGNANGQLGLGDTMERRMPVAVPGLVAIVEVEVAQAFGSFTCGRTESRVFCWGSNRISQLGDGRNDHEMCGDVVSPYDCSSDPVDVPALDDLDIDDLVLGSDSACVLEADGTLLCWGENDTGELGIDPDTASVFTTPTDVPGITGVDALTMGTGHTCGMFGGTVRCWGSNDEGQLGDGSLDHPEDCTPGTSLIDCSSTPVDVDLPAAASIVRAGLSHACAVIRDTEVWCWGWNERRQLGEPSRERQPTPVQVMGL